jgi:hypothetical protein
VHLFIIPPVQLAEGHHIARELGCRFVETSAKLGTNVTETFMDLVRQIRDHNRVRLKPFFFFLFEGVAAVPMTHFLLSAFHQTLQMRRFSMRPITPDSAIKLPGAGCWNSNTCVVS